MLMLFGCNSGWSENSKQLLLFSRYIFYCHSLLLPFFLCIFCSLLAFCIASDSFSNYHIYFLSKWWQRLVLCSVHCIKYNMRGVQCMSHTHFANAVSVPSLNRHSLPLCLHYCRATWTWVCTQNSRTKNWTKRNGTGTYFVENVSSCLFECVYEWVCASDLWQ